MIERAIEIKPFLNKLATNLSVLTNNWPNEKEWQILNDLLDLLAPFSFVTKMISTSNYPTIGEVRWFLLGIKNHLVQPRDDNYSLKSQVSKMKDTFNYYFDQINNSLHIPSFLTHVIKNQLMEE
jgi:hypothetical protein